MRIDEAEHFHYNHINGQRNKVQIKTSQSFMRYFLWTERESERVNVDSRFFKEGN